MQDLIKNLPTKNANIPPIVAEITTKGNDIKKPLQDPYIQAKVNDPPRVKIVPGITQTTNDI